MPEGVEVRYLRSLLDTERALRRAAEEQLTEWRRLAEELSAMMDPGALDQVTTSGRAPAKAREWGEFLRTQYSRRRALWEASADCDEELSAALDRVTELEEEVARLESALVSRPDGAAAGLAPRPPATPIQGSPPASQPGGEGALRPSASASRPVEAPAPGPSRQDSRPIVSKPDESKIYRFIPRDDVATSMAHRAALAILVLGSRGYSLRLQVLTEVGRRVNPEHPLNPDSGSLKRMAQRLASWGLVTQQVIVGDWARLAAMELTEKGKSAYRSMTGQEPVEGDLARLRRLHSGDEQAKHTAFVLGAAFHLWRRGRVEVRLVPTDFPSPFEPDLAFLEGGRWWGVECERWHPDRDRIPKWRNASLVQGRIYLIGTDEAKSSALAEEALTVTKEVYYTDMQALSQRDGEWNWKRAPKNSRRR